MGSKLKMNLDHLENTVLTSVTILTSVACCGFLTYKNGHSMPEIVWNPRLEDLTSQTSPK